MPLSSALESNPRNGLPRTAARLAQGGPLTIAYFGGSITQSDGWRTATFNWFKTHYPNVHFAEVPASIGGTGSTLGVYRMDRDLLPHKPDLAFIEFAVNDSHTSGEVIIGAMEGIVRKIRQSRPSCEIIFVYTVNSAMTASLRNGILDRAAAAHEKVADHYGIPSIHMAMEVAKQEGAGALVFTGAGDEKKALEAQGKLVFARDNCHPYPEGHQLYAEAVIRHLPGLLKPQGSPALPLPAPMDQGRWEASRMVTPDAFGLPPEWRRLERNEWPPIAWSADALPQLWLTDTPGAGHDLAFTGTAFGLFLVVGPTSGQIEWSLDGQPPVKICLFDAWCSFYRPHYQILVHHLKDGPHRIQIKLLAGEPDKAAILAAQKVTIDYPERYQGARVYLAAALITGEVTPSAR
jgi:lysophospholipase L1-like esterase